MPDLGTETEYVAFQTFCRDFLNGQTYALEVTFAACGNGTAPEWMQQLLERFLTCNVASMAGFAMKQTFDYVHRSARLEKARALVKVLELAQDNIKAINDDIDLRVGQQSMVLATRLPYRLDTVVHGEKMIHTVARAAHLELGTTVNNGREMETLKLNGREYLETTDLTHLMIAVEKLVDSYGDRSNRAAEMSVDLKSLSHAVRVYEQAVELLTVGKITFPRVNAAYLLAVKNGQLDSEEVKARLLELETQVQGLQANSELLPEKTDALQADFDEWLLWWIESLYGLR
jgi:hypothetical protein